jgi:hypothetical protein
MQLLLARRIGEHVLPPNVTFLAATNRRTDNAGVSGILAPVVSRFATVVELSPTIDDWTKWAVGAGIPPALIAFLRFRPDLLSVPSTTRDIENSPSPRSWRFVAKTMAIVPKHLEHISFAGSVGEGAADEFVSFLQIFRELPSPDSILLNPDVAVIPTNLAALYAVSASLAVHASEANFDRVMVYVERLIAGGLSEYAALLVRDALRRTPAIANSYAFINAQGGPLGRIIRGE